MSNNEDGQEVQPFRLEIAETFARLTIHGEFSSVEESSELVSGLNSAAENVSMVEVWVSSNGGNAHLLFEVVEALGKFDTIITICNSYAASAGSFLWGIGNIRVVSPYATLLFHRESYGHVGKTETHRSFSEHTEAIFSKFFDDTIGSMLTEDEREKTKLTEVLITGQEMIDRDQAMSFKDYCAREKASESRFVALGTVMLDTESGNHLLVDAETAKAKVVADLSVYSQTFRVYDLAVAEHIRVDCPDDEEVTLIHRDDFYSSIKSDQGDDHDDYPDDNEDQEGS